MKIFLKKWLYKLLALIRIFKCRLYYFYLKAFFSYIGKNTLIFPKINFIFPLKIYISKNCIIRSGVTLNGRSENEIGIFLGKGVSIREFSYIDSYGGKINIDDYCAIGHHCVIGGHGGLYIGKYTMIGGLTYIIPSNHNYKKTNLPYMFQGEVRKPIKIGSNVWIGAGCIILAGTKIGDNAIIGAGSVVTKDIPKNSLAIGVPAKVIRKIN